MWWYPATGKWGGSVPSGIGGATACITEVGAKGHGLILPRGPSHRLHHGGGGQGSRFNTASRSECIEVMRSDEVMKVRWDRNCRATAVTLLYCVYKTSKDLERLNLYMKESVNELAR